MLTPKNTALVIFGLVVIGGALLYFFNNGSGSVATATPPSGLYSFQYPANWKKVISSSNLNNPTGSGASDSVAVQAFDLSSISFSSVSVSPYAYNSRGLEGAQSEFDLNFRNQEKTPVMIAGQNTYEYTQALGRNSYTDTLITIPLTHNNGLYLLEYRTSQQNFAQHPDILSGILSSFSFLK